MMQPWDVIRQLESDNSRLYKEGVLKALLLQAPHDADFWEGCRLALDSMITFGVKKVPTKTTDDGYGLDFEAFALAITGLIRRSITGNAAQTFINNLMSASTKEQWNDWYRRILIKDLRCGVTETTINKIRPGTIPVFSCQLAKDAADNEGKMRGKKVLDYKLDGVRVLAVIRKPDTVFDHQLSTVTLHSRNGKVFENFPHIVSQLEQAAEEFGGDCVLDGEITSASFQDLMTQVHRKRDADAGDAVFNIFDVIPMEAFEAGYYGATQLMRRRDLNESFSHLNEQPNLRLLDYVVADLDDSTGQATLDDMRDEAARLGLEGVMVKDADAPYECKRSSAWLKIKPNITLDLTVIDTEAGTGRNEGRLGALVCEGEDGGRTIKVNVGSGFSDSNRDDIWRDRASVLGQVVEVKADAVTHNQDGSYSLRFPRFQRFRGFEVGEKI